MNRVKPGQPSQEDPSPDQPLWRNYGYFLLLLSAVLFIQTYLQDPSDVETMSYSDFLAALEARKITDIVISEEKIMGKLLGDKSEKAKTFSVVPVNDPKIVDRLKETGIKFRAERQSSFWTSFSSWILPFALFYFVWTLLFRRMAGVSQGGIGMLGFTKSKAKVFIEKDIKVTFDDVAGINEAKEELKEIVSFLQDPKKFSRLGGRAPKGVLLVGPPGTGKTLLARALAGEAKVPFFSINGSEFVELFVGIGAARVRDLFEQSRKQAPCILFIDEIDALGKSRGLGIGPGAHDEKEQTLNQLLAEMDGFDPSHGVIILAATNRPEILDPALLRAGRFDRQVLVNLPDQVGREQILKVHSKGIQMDPNVRFERIAALTAGFSGADIANLVNEAALIATREDAELVTEKDFTQAIERIVAGLEHKKKVMNPEEKRRIAFHEMGHATVALGRSATDKVHKISIIARGMGALGYTLQRPTEDRYLMDRGELLNKIAVLLGGRAAERLFFHEISTGAADDLAKATDLARSMVTQYGMSDKVGMSTYEGPRAPLLQLPFYSRERFPYSEEMAERIDSEVNVLLEEGLELASACLKSHRVFMTEGAARLLQVETLDETIIRKLWEKYGKHPNDQVQNQRQQVRR